MITRAGKGLLNAGKLFSSRANHYDMITLGGGSGGLFTALKAKQYGKKVAVIDNYRLGGRCVHAGCIPKKVIYHATMIKEDMELGPQYGVTFDNTRIDWLKIKEVRDNYTLSMHVDYVNMCQQAGVEFISGKGKFLGKDEIEVTESNTGKTKRMTADHIVISTGSRPLMPKFIEGIDHCINTDSFFNLTEVPNRIFVIGGGYIGTEIACALNAIGVKTTMCSQDDALVTPFDKEITDCLKNYIQNTGIDVILNSPVHKISKTSKGTYTAHYGNNGVTEADAVLCAAGIKANTENLGLENIGVKLNRNGTVVVDDYENTSVKGVYAIGDATGKVVLTPVAKTAGARLATRLFANDPNSKLDYTIIPSVAFTHPPMGKVGLTEKDAIERYGKKNVTVYKTNFVNLFYQVTTHKQPTLFKLVCKLPEERVIGVHAIGRGVDEMMQGYSVALTAGATKKDYDSTLAIHPTSSEMFVTMGQYH
jgi:glutathione reductase (NADPH)